MIWTVTSLISSRLELQMDIPLSQVLSHLMLWTDLSSFHFQLRFHLVFNFGRIYLVSFFHEESLWTYILASRISIVHAYFSFLWISLNEYTNIKDSNSILENTSYIYLKIQTYVSIRPQAWHMLASQCLIELKIQTNSSMNSTKVKTLMYFLRDY